MVVHTIITEPNQCMLSNGGLKGAGDNIIHCEHGKSGAMTPGHQNCTLSLSLSLSLYLSLSLSLSLSVSVLTAIFQMDLG